MVAGAAVLTLVGSAVSVLQSCIGPLDRYGGVDDSLRQRVVAEHRQQLAASSDGDDAASPRVLSEVTREPSDVEQRLTPERLDELNTISGAEAYQGVAVEPGKDLTGRSELRTVDLSLDEAVRLAVEGNLDLAVARLSPRIAEQQVAQAAAAFDAVLFTNVNYQNLDTPQPVGVIPGLSNDIQSENFSLNTGVRKTFTTGTQVQLETTIARNKRVPSFFAVDSYYDADVLLSLRQPLLRNFGRDNQTAQIVLTRNAQESTREQLRQSMQQLVADVVDAYWNVDVARRQVLIQQRLLDRAEEVRDNLQERAEYDVSPVRITEANSRVELRRSDLIRVRAQARNTSDRLKRLLNSDRLPLADETLIVATDSPVDAPITYSLLDSVTTALSRRPELQQSLLSISDAQVRQRLADNAVLPLLDFTAATGLNGIDTDTWPQAYSDLGDANYIDYILGVNFEVPLGNRGAKAFAAQRALERQQAVLAYRRDAQDVVLDVKNALRSVLTNYELVGATRAARWAAADSLRSINVQEEVGVALTDEFLLDLKLNAQERLASAETQEAVALGDYMTALSDLYRAMGTITERYGVEVGDQSK